MTPAQTVVAHPAPSRRSPLPVALAAIGLAVALVSAVMLINDARDVTPTAASSETSTGELARLEAAVREMPDNAETWAQLGAAYVDHARVNSDPSAYPKAERALDRSLTLQPEGNWQALAAHGALAAGRHDFAPALDYAERARAMQPTSSFILGIIVDSLTELGRYPEAVEAAQAMVDLRPDLTSYARVSYQRELHGDTNGAIVAMQDVLRAAGNPGERAFALYYLGQLEWGRGALGAAEAHYNAALRADPEAMQALAGLGKVAAARGDLSTAITNYERAVESFPDPEILKELGELYLVAGRTADAEASLARSAEENAKQAAGGVDINLEIALLSADHRRNLDVGLAAAQREWELRESIHVADALGWQLHVHGRHDEALAYADKSLQLGTQSATFLFHRAEIHRALGNTDAARADYEAALGLNPHFSFLHRDHALRAAAEVGAAV